MHSLEQDPTRGHGDGAIVTKAFGNGPRIYTNFKPPY